MRERRRADQPFWAHAFLAERHCRWALARWPPTAACPGGAVVSAASTRRLPALVRSGNLDRDDRRACLRGDGGVSAEVGERSPDCRIARGSSLGRGRGCSVANRQWCVAAGVERTPQGHPGLPLRPPREGQDSLPGVWAVSWIRNAQARLGADGAPRSTCGCPARNRLVVVRRVAVDRSAQREERCSSPSTCSG
jgi:hypothetical protein